MIGAEVVKRAAPDGCTVFGHFGPHSDNTSLYTKLSYEAVKDFASISPIILTESILVVPTASPTTSMTELIALSRSKPGGLN